VGTHETLLAYLVRRLLENGANTSFVNRIADRSDQHRRAGGRPGGDGRADGARGGRSPHPAIALPPALFGAERRNSRGLDLASEQTLATLAPVLLATRGTPGAPHRRSQGVRHSGAAGEIRNPADRRDVVGEVVEATPMPKCASRRRRGCRAARWQARPPAERATTLERAADLHGSAAPRLIGLIVREAGKTLANAVGEVREAVDFLRYYAAQARTELAGSAAQPLGPVVCISPWNFPLAIFTGQVAAALAAGNTVLAKPAEQTPLIAARGRALLHEAGVPPAMRCSCCRPRRDGRRAAGGRRAHRGVVFTGSTECARDQPHAGGARRRRSCR
jgi:RHH-type proline utilization regulon transcriptional repressor/proline dehydrogenase/delta 1-pyrroline-5-carboxylate dehydrogenase